MSNQPPIRLLRAALAIAATLLVLDLCWLGLVAKQLYAEHLGDLQAPQVNGLAAALFYVMYISAVLIHAALPAVSLGDAAKRGAGLGFVAYATWNLTNWAVLAGWPAGLLPFDLTWGVVLTATAAAAGWKAR